MTQADRERTLTKTLARYENWQAGARSVGGRRMADDFFREVVAGEMGADGRRVIEAARVRFAEKLEGAVTLSSKAGRPASAAVTWAKLGYPQGGDALREAAELVFYITVHQLVETMLAEIRDEEIVAAQLPEPPETPEAAAGDDAPGAAGAGAARAPAPPIDAPEDDPEGSSSQQQLYTGLWKTIVLETAFRQAETPAALARVKAAFRSHSGMSDRIAHDLVLAFEAEKRLAAREGIKFAATLAGFASESLGERWFKRVQGGTTRTYKVVPQREFLRHLARLSARTLTLRQHAPLIERPIAWGTRGIRQGGFHVLPLPFFKYHWKNGPIRDFLGEVERSADLTDVFSAANALQDTAWAVNRRVWAVVRSLYQIADVPLCDDETPFAASPLEAVVHGDGAARVKEAAGADRAAQIEALPPATREAWREWIGKSFYIRKHGRRKGPGARLNTHLSLGTLLDALARERFYFAYQIDARGRFYPVSGSFSPQGDALTRALLAFADAKELTPEGARYLAVQGSQHVSGARILADLGVAERRSPTHDERVRWIELHTPQIVACAVDPLAQRWWCETADNEFMFLAFCFAWADWRRGQEAGTPVYCNLPIYVDGTCNGLQHVAAITRDPALAQATNVISAGLPRDIYGELAAVVAGRMREAPPLRKARGKAKPFSAAERDRVIEFLDAGFVPVDRAMAKAVVMIIPYGAGLETFRYEIAELLSRRILGDRRDPVANPKAVGWILERPIEADRMLDRGLRREVFDWLAEKCARHLAEHFDAALDAAFPSIAAFKRRLSAAAGPVLARGLPLMWVSPSGLPVLQDSFVLEEDPIDIKALRNRVRFSMRTKLDAISPIAQRSAVLPNFIHSLDAAHLVKTVNRARACGITALATVHDCYATHAADAAALGECIRRGFVDVYPAHVDRLADFERWCRCLADPAADAGVPVTEAERVWLGLARRWLSRAARGPEPAAAPRESPAAEPSADAPGPLPYFIDKVLESPYFFS